MRQISDQLYKKIYNVSQEVIENFRAKGIIIPVKMDNGNVQVGHYIVSKASQGFYTVTTNNGLLVADRINLPQTAILIANNLTLGKFLDNNLLTLDREYGYASFEEDLFKKIVKSKRSSAHKTSLWMSKIDKIKFKKKLCKHTIDESFEKLRKIA
jgi:hypothetical protein